MFKVTLSGINEQLASLSRLEQDQLPFATALALTRTAQEVQKGMRQEMGKVFDRPTRATLDGVFIEPATRERMESRVWINDGGTSAFRRAEARRTNTAVSKWEQERHALKWLGPQVYGGGRDGKGFENMLRRAGALGSDQYVLPGDKYPLDRHGNMGNGQIRKILSGASLITEEGYDANRTDSARSSAKGNKRFFLIRKGRRAIGIAERLKYGVGARPSDIRMVMVFARRPTYGPKLDFFGVAERIAADQLPIQFELALARALATRRR